MRISEIFEKMRPAPVDAINARRRSLETQGHQILNLGQAIPDLLPPAAALDTLASRMEDRSTHVYTADQGLADLREELALVLRTQFGGLSCNADRIIVTAGANHAFLITCMSLLEPGDNVGLLSPYFLNHEMIVRACGANVIELVLSGNENEITDQAIDSLIETHRLKMIVIVNPCNPSGKILSNKYYEYLPRMPAERHCFGRRRSLPNVCARSPQV